jgi:hypothetical protein
MNTSKTSTPKKSAILLDLIDDSSLSDSWEQLFDLDKIDQDIADNNTQAIDQHFSNFLLSLGISDLGFDSYDEIVSNLYEIKEASEG